MYSTVNTAVFKLQKQILKNKIMENKKKKEAQKRLESDRKKDAKRLETDKKQQPKKLEESKYDKNAPVEFVEANDARPESTPDVENREDDLKKFESGEMGEEQFRYNDDGKPYGESRKMDIDTKTNPK